MEPMNRMKLPSFPTLFNHSPIQPFPFPSNRGGADFHGRVLPDVKRRATFSGPALRALCDLCGNHLSSGLRELLLEILQNMSRQNTNA